ncbi:MAG: transcription termination factor NusA [Candidatus Marinimicrobia bacterium]|mgnify:FL=1|nr:transcription termination factor NusA [Candidatus Neomarinimicrobiota bacterium]MBT3936286.1 transcription termination factor NusA [Candidatus Neomarinimicrobiota bacterium]MBT3961345.1 transcription termination factor NusA [Candidatus Neomarinimicrobiota bacterium]MBT4382945.1 transcription termination factor NusA [Candidatus Neomarinimicrobiota bacterium]MBT4637113.1 transcription termination factor NusA [Candidatus Neomarinimicrobiota bacterium]
MINRELIEVFSEIAREKNVDRSELATIMEELFLYVIEKEYGDSSNCSVIVNLDKGEIEIYAEKTIVEEVDDYKVEITLEDACQKEPDAAADLEVGDIFVEVIDPMIFGRRIVTTAKQFFAQRIREVERNYVFEDYSNRVGEIVIGVVKQVQRDNVFVDIDRAELKMPKREQISSERYRRGDTIRAIIKSVEDTSKGPEIIISRSNDTFLQKLFEMEVPEIEDSIIDITAISRQPGERAKIIVRSNDRRIDPVGACVGMRGSRIQAVVRELNNEKIDIVNYSEQPEILITRALSPAKPVNLYIDDDKKYCIAIFEDDDLNFAIGRNGMNINLASRITDYRIDAFGENEYERIQSDQKTVLSEIDGITETTAKNLADVGVKIVSELLGADEDILLSAKGIGESSLDDIYTAVQEFIEREIPTADDDFMEVEVELDDNVKSSDEPITESTK